MEKGIIDLRGFMTKSSYNRVKSYFYLYDQLFTYNFDDFKDIQLNSGYGKISHFENINLLVDQELIKTFNPAEFNALKIKPQNEESFVELLNLLSEVHEDHLNANKLPIDTKGSSEEESYQHFIKRNGFDLYPLQERLYALLYGEKYNVKLHPATSLKCYNVLDMPTHKSDIYKILIDKFPIPADDTPLSDIIQYKNEESNRLRFLRLKTWVNKISRSGFSENEILDEIDTLLMEYRKEMELSGLKMKNAKIEFAYKIVPSLMENILKINFSKLVDPFIKLRMEKISLLKAEHNAKGNELSYLLNAK